MGHIAALVWSFILLHFICPTVKAGRVVQKGGDRVHIKTRQGIKRPDGVYPCFADYHFPYIDHYAGIVFQRNRLG